MTSAQRRLLLIAAAAAVVFLGVPAAQVLMRVLAPEEEPPAAAVGTAAAEHRTMRERLRYPGTLQAELHTAVVPKLAGTVQAVHVRENQSVERDEQLLSIDDRIVRLEMRQAEAAMNAAAAELRRARRGARDEELDSARATVSQAEQDFTVAENAFRRAERLYEQGALSRSDFEQAENRLARARTALENARRELKILEDGPTAEEIDALEANLEAARRHYELAALRYDDARVLAPVSGTVSELLVEHGDTVGTEDPVALIVSDELIKLKLPIPERHYGRFIELDRTETHIPVTVRPTALDGNPQFEGELTRVGRTVAPDSRTFTVEAAIANPEGELRGGMYVNAYITVQEVTDAIAVPRGAVLRRAHRRVVFVFEPENRNGEGAARHGTARVKEVETGIEADGMVEVRAGLEPGATVIVRGNAFLEDGQAVRRAAEEAQ